MATLMGVLAGLSRMSSDSEIIAFRTMGIANRKILRPVMIFSFLTWFISSWFIMYLTPEANFRLNKLITGVLFSQSVANIKPGVVYQELPFYSLYFKEINQNNEWQDVFLYSMRSATEDTAIFAKRGHFLYDSAQKENYIVLFDGSIHSFKKKEADKYSLTLFTQRNEKIAKLFPVRRTRSSSQLIFPALVKRLKEKPRDLLLAMEFHKKFALPFACLVLGFLGLALGISTKKGGRISGFVISLAIIFIYYVAMTSGRNLILKGLVTPFWGSWFPNLFLIAAAVPLYILSAHEKQISWEKIFFFSSGFGRLGAALRRRRGLNTRFTVGWPLKILDAYVLKKILLAFVLVFSSLLLVFYIINIVELADDVIENNVPFSLVLKYNYLTTPEIISYVLPIAILTGILLAYSLMSKNNEVVAAQVSGISLYRLAGPAVALGLLFSLAAFYLQENILPDANRQSSQVLNIIRNRKSIVDMEFSKNWVIGRQGDVIYFYDYLEKAQNRLVNFNVIRLDSQFTPRQRLHARYARWIGRHELLLSNGFSREFSNNLPVAFATFSDRKITISEERRSFVQSIKFSSQMNIRELRRYIEFLKKSHSDSTRYEAQLFYQYAFPFSSLIMVLIAIPFSFMMGNRGALFGIGIAVAIAMVYWGALGIFSSLGSTAVLSPMLSAFAPLALFALISLYLIVNIKT